MASPVALGVLRRPRPPRRFHVLKACFKSKVQPTVSGSRHEGAADHAHQAWRGTRNVGIIAHIDAGKTTTTEHLALSAGMLKRAGDVDRGNTITDFLEDERARGITIQSAAITLAWAGATVNVVDTPGHVDFGLEVERALRVMDGCVVVIDAIAGAQVQTRTVWRQARKQSLPALAFVNKMDRSEASLPRAIDSLASRLGMRPILIQLPVDEGPDFRAVVDLLTMQELRWGKPAGREGGGLELLSTELTPSLHADDDRGALARRALEARGRLVEELSEVDDEVAEAYLEAPNPAAVEESVLRAALRRATMASAAVPVLCGSALRGVGIELLLDAICSFLPGPEDRPPPEVHTADAGDVASARDVAASARALALAFKVVHDSQGRPVVFTRVYGGEVSAGMSLINTATAASERVASILRIEGADFVPLDRASAGSIVALAGLKGVRTGDTLFSGALGAALPRLEGVAVPDPVFFASVEAPSAAVQSALDAALVRLGLEDPSLVVRSDEDTGQLLLGGMGELHLEIARERLHREGLGVRMGVPRVAYREACVDEARREVAITEHVHVGGRDFAVDVCVEVTGESSDAAHAYAPGSGCAWEVDETAVSHLGARDRAAVSEGAADGASAGSLAGLPLMGTRLRVLRVGTEHGSPVPAVALRVAVANAASRALAKSPGALLEPVMRVEVVASSTSVGDVLADLTGHRRATVLGVGVSDVDSAQQHVSALVPLAELVGYATRLRSMTHGEGVLTMDFAHYARLDAAVERSVLLDLRGW